MLALCLMLLGTYYAKNYAGIIGRGLSMVSIAEYGQRKVDHGLCISTVEYGQRKADHGQGGVTPVASVLPSATAVKIGQNLDRKNFILALHIFCDCIFYR